MSPGLDTSPETVSGTLLQTMDWSNHWKCSSVQVYIQYFDFNMAEAVVVLRSVAWDVWSVTGSYIHWQTYTFTLTNIYIDWVVLQSVTFRFRNFSVSKLFHFFWWYRYRFRKILVSKKVSVSVSKNFGIKKSIGIGFEKNWYRKKYRYRFRKKLVLKKYESISKQFDKKILKF